MAACSCIIDARPTMSAIRDVQGKGRGLRTAPGKDNLITLTMRGTRGEAVVSAERKRDRVAPDIVLCPECHAVLPKPKPAKCPQCGHVFFAVTRYQERDGELVRFGSGEPDSDRRGASLETKQHWYGAFLWICDEKGHSRGRAYHLYCEKFKEKPPLELAGDSAPRATWRRAAEFRPQPRHRYAAPSLMQRRGRMAKISKIGLSPKLILEGSESWTRGAARQRASRLRAELFKLTDCLLPNYNLRIDIWGPVIAAVLNKEESGPYRLSPTRVRTWPGLDHDTLKCDLIHHRYFHASVSELSDYCTRAAARGGCQARHAASWKGLNRISIFYVDFVTSPGWTIQSCDRYRLSGCLRRH